jgi:hypothetical protein
MQWIGRYAAMALNRLTGRCGHFRQARCFSTPIEPGDTRRVLATLRTIHANPNVAGVRKGFHDPWSHDGHDGRLEGCARRQAHDWRRYRPRAKPVAGRVVAGRICHCRRNGHGWRKRSEGPLGPGEAAVSRSAGRQMGAEAGERRGAEIGESALVRSGSSGNKLFQLLWPGAGGQRKQRGPLSIGKGPRDGLKVPGIAQPAGRVGAVVRVALMRFLSWRLKPKAAAAPKRGRGPGTGRGVYITGRGGRVPVKIEEESRQSMS